MQIDEQIYSVLTAAPAVTGLVGARLYPVQGLQAAALPYVVWTRISTVPETQHDTAGTPGLHRSVYQVSCYDTTFRAADALAAAVGAALLAQGALGQAASLEDRRDAYDTDAEIYRSDLDISIWHTA